MQQFTVPQFIDVEDKVIGPITVRQFVIELIVFLCVALFYKIFDFSLFLVSGIFVFLTGSAFAFVKINGMPLHFLVLNMIQTFKSARLRVWNNVDMVVEIEEPEIKVYNEVKVDTTRARSLSRLNELALVVDTKGVYESSESDNVKVIHNEDGFNNDQDIKLD